MAGTTGARDAPTIMTDDPDRCHSLSRGVAVAVRSENALWRGALPDAPAVLERAARAALAGARGRGGGARGPLEISFLLSDDARLRRLNRDFRGQDRPTNVLSFPAEDDDRSDDSDTGSDTGPRLLGDVAFSFETLEREAAARSMSLADRLSHLAVHGVLHLLGYDHAAAPDAERMECLEAAVLAELGIADPYAPDGRRGEAAP